MKNLTKLTKNVKYGLTAGLTMAVFSVQNANAQGVADVSDTLQTQLGALPNLFVSAAYVMGIGFAIAGLFKLKEYVDDPSGSAMKDALIRLGLAGALLILPFVINTSADTFGGDDAGTFAVDDLDF